MKMIKYSNKHLNYSIMLYGIPRRGWVPLKISSSGYFSGSVALQSSLAI